MALDLRRGGGIRTHDLFVPNYWRQGYLWSVPRSGGHQWSVLAGEGRCGCCTRLLYGLAERTGNLGVPMVENRWVERSAIDVDDRSLPVMNWATIVVQEAYLTDL